MESGLELNNSEELQVLHATRYASTSFDEREQRIETTQSRKSAKEGLVSQLGSCSNMGARPSKEELLYQAVENGNHQLVKCLRRHGVSLEWVDKQGRTPLSLACTRKELFDMAVALLDLGANLNAYTPGSNGGFPLHHAAKRGLNKTVSFLISRGADPLAINDNNKTPLDMARMRRHTSVLHIMENWVSLFSGMVREEVLRPQRATNLVRAVVLPAKSNPRSLLKRELLIYESLEAAQPRTTLFLWKSKTELKWNSGANAELLITDKTTKKNYKFLSELDGDKAQLDRLYRACRGNPPEIPQPGIPRHPDDIALALAIDASLQHQDVVSLPTHPDNVALHMAIDASLQHAEEAALAMASDASLQTAVSISPCPPAEEDSSNGWSEESYKGCPQSRRSPPLVAGAALYPASILGRSLEAGPSTKTPSAEVKGAEKRGSACVVCWDGPAEAVCIPCGHLAGCMDCLKEIKKKRWGCPVCRTPIKQAMKVYTV